MDAIAKPNQIYRGIFKNVGNDGGNRHRAADRETYLCKRESAKHINLINFHSNPNEFIVYRSNLEGFNPDLYSVVPILGMWIK
jgi:hypothetical protein